MKQPLIAAMMLVMGIIAFSHSATNKPSSSIVWDTNSLLDQSAWVVDGSNTSALVVNWLSMTNYIGWSRGTAYAGIPVSSNALTVLTNDAYLVGYSETDKCPLWVCYVLNATTGQPYEELVRAAYYEVLLESRPKTSFKTDKRTTAQVKTGDYTNTGYDRGHMAPSYGIGLSHGTNAQLQTFLMSNVIPQTPDMNRGIWKRLEQKAANDWAQERDKIWVITGPVFIGTNRINGVRIPAGSFKILVDETYSYRRYGDVEVQAFLMPQYPLEDATLGLYLTTVDEIERQTGLDFFTELPDENEEELERGTW